MPLLLTMTWESLFACDDPSWHDKRTDGNAMCIQESMWLSIPCIGKELTEGFKRAGPAVWVGGGGWGASFHHMSQTGSITDFFVILAVDQFMIMFFQDL